MKLRSALLAATVLAMPFAASAQPVTGLYVGAGAGVNVMHEASRSTPTPTARLWTVNLSRAVGSASVLSPGWGFGNGLRAELEGDYRNNAFNRQDGASLGGTRAATSVTEVRPDGERAVRLCRDDALVRAVCWGRPGLPGPNEKGVALTVLTRPSSRVEKTKSEGSFGYQAIVGAVIPLTAIPGLAITAEYRFMGLAGNRNFNPLNGRRPRPGFGTST